MFLLRVKGGSPYKGECVFHSFRKAKSVDTLPMLAMEFLLEKIISIGLIFQRFAGFLSLYKKSPVFQSFLDPFPRKNECFTQEITIKQLIQYGGFYGREK